MFKEDREKGVIDGKDYGGKRRGEKGKAFG